MKKAVVVCVCLLVVVMSCDHVYREYDKASFPDYSWKHGQEVKFNPSITDTSKKYALTLGVRHVHGLQLNELNMRVTITAPSGKKTTKDYVLTIQDASGKYVGNCAGDMCDNEKIVDDSLTFDEAGEYVITITHQVQTEKIPGIMEVGVIIDEKK